MSHSAAFYHDPRFDHIVIYMIDISSQLPYYNYAAWSTSTGPTPHGRRIPLAHRLSQRLILIHNISDNFADNNDYSCDSLLLGNAIGSSGIPEAYEICRTYKT